MAAIVYKFPMSPGGKLGGIAEPMEIKLPADAQILHIDVQHGELQMWVLTNPDLETAETRTFIMLPTGHVLPDHPLNLTHHATLILSGGDYVFHIFERVL